LSCDIKKKLDANDYSFDHLTLIVSLHYLVKYRLLNLLLARPVESHSGARGNILAGPTNIFTGPLWENLFAFFFSKWYILAYFIFLADDWAPQTSQGPG